MATGKPITIETTDIWTEVESTKVLVSEEYLIQGKTQEKALIAISDTQPTTDEAFVIANDSSLSSIVYPITKKIWMKSLKEGKASKFTIHSW